MPSVRRASPFFLLVADVRRYGSTRCSIPIRRYDIALTYASIPGLFQDAAFFIQ